MSDETEVQQGSEIVVHQEQMPSAASIFERALVAANSGLDAANVAVFLEMANKQQDREAEKRYRMAKHNALLEMPAISKHGAIINHKTKEVQSRYAKFEDIHRVVTPILAKHKLILSFNLGHEGQMVTVQPILSYSDGELAFEEKGGWMVLAVDTTGSKNATQGAGSAASYGKRHAMKAMLNIIEEGEDTDGRANVDPYDMLTDELKQLVDEARIKTAEGSAAYEEFFKALAHEQRGFLGFNFAEPGVTWHTQNKNAAAAADKR